MFYLKRNLPGWERALLAATAALFWLPPGMMVTLAWASAATLGLTSVIGFCPACALVGRKPLQTLP
jgi:hypothetical protein